MKKIIKRIASCVVALCLVVGSMFVLAGCGKDPVKENKVMNVDVNPKLEFVLDNENKVVSVNALNDDGTCILQGNVTFIGLTAEDAVELFIDKAKEYGFVIEGDTNALTVSVSGEGADKLLNDVKSAAESHITSLGLNLSVAKEKINREALEQIVAHCYQEYTVSQIDELSNNELVELIKKSREETKDLLTQELKDLYYTERAEGVMEAKIAEIKAQINAGSNSLKKIEVVALESLYSALNSAYDSIQSIYTNSMASLNSKMEAYVELKKDYIEARKAGNLEIAESYGTTLNSVEKQLNDARELINTQINALNSDLDTAKNSVLSKISELKSGLNLENIESKINSAKDSVLSTLKTTYEDINKNVWLDNAAA